MLVLLALLSALPSALAVPPGYEPKDGDILLQVSTSSQSKAIQIATRSPFSHTGVVLHREGVPYVYEAVQPVQFVPIDDWIARGEGGRFAALRLKEADEYITDSSVAALRELMDGWLGVSYDPWFGWEDDRLYCSELVWKAYDRALGVQLGQPTRIGDFVLSHPLVRQKLAERYGDKVPLDEPAVPPSILAESDLLEWAYTDFSD